VKECSRDGIIKFIMINLRDSDGKQEPSETETYIFNILPA
jgi:hypothetical protein